MLPSTEQGGSGLSELSGRCPQRCGACAVVKAYTRALDAPRQTAKGTAAMPAPRQKRPHGKPALGASLRRLDNVRRKGRAQDRHRRRPLQPWADQARAAPRGKVNLGARVDLSIETVVEVRGDNARSSLLTAVCAALEAGPGGPPGPSSLL